ncbi:hypothetical protein TCON_0274 [Astathelohania contejeani]|uniref:Uncharacterized protein n=1 Tax=Astathelohania contejeani TaxID=164912 RepID=A0ABQ7I257_9MICR|nr:hypothetical protein TCON_0274 [Thelohania contejeani]
MKMFLATFLLMKCYARSKCEDKFDLKSTYLGVDGAPNIESNPSNVISSAFDNKKNNSEKIMLNSSNNESNCDLNLQSSKILEQKPLDGCYKDQSDCNSEYFSCFDNIEQLNDYFSMEQKNPNDHVKNINTETPKKNFLSSGYSYFTNGLSFCVKKAKDAINYVTPGLSYTKEKIYRVFDKMLYHRNDEQKAAVINENPRDPGPAAGVEKILYASEENTAIKKSNFPLFILGGLTAVLIVLSIKQFYHK